MKRIPLTQGKFALVDDADYPQVSKFTWFAHRSNKTWYAERGVYRKGRSPNIIKLHQFLLPGIARVDHKNLNGLDNRRRNLRPATAAQNIMNGRKHVGCASPFKGVTWHAQSAQWRARITVNGRLRSLGLFASEICAAYAYDAAAKTFFGAFARPNF